KGAIEAHTSGLAAYLGSATPSADVSATHVRVTLEGAAYRVPTDQTLMTILVRATYSAAGEEGLAALWNSLNASLKGKLAQIETTAQQARALRWSFGTAAARVPSYSAQQAAVTDGLRDIDAVLEQERDAYARALESFRRGLGALRQVQADFLRRLEGQLYLWWALLLQQNREVVRQESQRYSPPRESDKKSGSDIKSGDQLKVDQQVVAYASLDRSAIARLRSMRGQEAFTEMRKALGLLAYQRTKVASIKLGAQVQYWMSMVDLAMLPFAGSPALVP